MQKQVQALDILQDAPFNLEAIGIDCNGIKLFVKAGGTFPTSGWENARLVYRVPRPGTQPRPEDFAEFDLIADPPPKGTLVADVVTPLIAVTQVTLIARVHGVRVIGRNSSQEVFIRFDTDCPTGGPEGDDFVPIPWLRATGGCDLGG